MEINIKWVRKESNFWESSLQMEYASFEDKTFKRASMTTFVIKGLLEITAVLGFLLLLPGVGWWKLVRPKTKMIIQYIDFVPDSCQEELLTFVEWLY